MYLPKLISITAGNAGILVALKIEKIQTGCCLEKYFFLSFKYYNIYVTNHSHNHNTIEILKYTVEPR